MLLGITVLAVAMSRRARCSSAGSSCSAPRLTDTPLPLIAPALIGVTPLLVLLFAWSYHTIPAEIYDLAAEAGLGPFGTWWRVAVPMRRGAVAVAVAVAFVVSWGNLSDPLLYIYDERWFTLPLGLVSLAELPPTDQGLMLAAAVIAIVPGARHGVLSCNVISTNGGCECGTRTVGLARCVLVLVLATAACEGEHPPAAHGSR